MKTLDGAVAAVVASGNCSGCGACTLLDDGLRMHLNEYGYARPTRVAGTRGSRGDAAAFRKLCPGVGVAAARPSGSRRHPTMGPHLGVWTVHASDAEVRRRGSSGGAITAITTWLLERGEAAKVIGASADAVEPRRTVSVTLQSKEEVLAAAGSRYAPTSNASVGAVRDAGAAVVGKPCEVAALRALASVTPGQHAPLLISFFCAGTPSQHATEKLLEFLGMPPLTPLRELWYRGRGWPGRFTAIATDGRTVSTDYDDSWGAHLGPTAQWRCKLCPDGVGESADLVAADFWHTDDRGYPVFTESEGVSALVARTARGLDVVERAIAAGVIVAAPLHIDRLAAVQPLQRRRRQLLFARLLGARLAGRTVPRYRGFGLLRLALHRPMQAVRTARGTYRRARETGVTP
ncbi:hypothetical protein FVA74_02080 [Salinibacterium sp. dk2585]|uniref:Coenzyme F420 hydrogenase/dehydrogenase, beta subunit C-terminal domain n=1 Tax=unclassified Salinibacterium TaxID=2632331 RepID=UPI0011C245E8|nr:MULTISPECIES: Coenzyme F420 hydrogenase/dehydrogenase, beta subunit C-terminal domain [unclassified Salinibacterium]QEE60492.1 hypothetical protein FVA74_02080 [Salinibacterium sp. dk2585]TXK55564.1 hypothetical protein FVP63_02225 [Salinibacterium sp. dk5596]